MKRKGLELELSNFADTIFKRTYAYDDNESWEGCARRVSKFVANGDKKLEDQFYNIISTRKFIPGGRYLYSAGRDISQTTNCFLLRAGDSRESWGNLLNKHVIALSLGGGVGTYYGDVREKGAPIKRYGGYAGGPISLMAMVNEVARHVMAGGKRRSALWAGLPWSHPDIKEFVSSKNWDPYVKAVKEKDFNFPAMLDMTNISVCLDDAFFRQVSRNQSTWDLYYSVCKSMCKTGEPGFSIDVKKNKNQVLRNPCITLDNYVLTDLGYKQVKELINNETTLWTGKQWASNVTFKKTQSSVDVLKVNITGGRSIRCDKTHGFFVEKWQGAGQRRKLVSITKVRADLLKPNDILHISPPKSFDCVEFNSEGYTHGWIFGDGSFNKGKAELTLCSDSSKECLSFITGASTITNPDSRGYCRIYFPTDSRMVNWTKEEIPNEIYQAKPSYITSFLAGLWDADGHFREDKYGIQLASVKVNFLRGVSRLLEQLGIFSNISKNGKDGKNNKQQYQLNIEQGSVSNFLDLIPTKRCRMQVREDYKPYREWKPKVISVEKDGKEDVYCADVKVEEHSFMCEGIIISNCTEITSDTDSDCCNLGSINLGRIKDLNELEEVTALATKFLYLGTFVGVLPHADFQAVREKNRRIGLGLMGLHEWCLRNDQSYEPSGVLGKWLTNWAQISDKVAKEVAKEKNSVEPIAVRAIAPTGTIGIIGETTTGIEPVFCVSYKRRWLDNSGKWKYRYVIDPTAARLIEEGINPDDIEDSVSMSKKVESRISMQAFVQDFVDQAISSTINLPEWGEYGNNNAKQFAEILLKYLPRLRGITVYPEGSRPGQPITPIKYETAIRHGDVVYEEDPDRCSGGVCGI